MELEMHSAHGARHAPDWQVAAVAGFAAGAVLMVLELFWAAALGNEGPWRISHLVAALVMGPGILQATAPSFDLAVVSVALVTHYVLGIVFGLALGYIIAGLRREATAGRAEWIGALFGVALYVINFYGLAQLFPWFVELRGWSTLIAHLVFGLTAALLYWKLARHPPTGAPY